MSLSHPLISTDIKSDIYGRLPCNVNSLSESDNSDEAEELFEEIGDLAGTVLDE